MFIYSEAMFIYRIMTSFLRVTNCFGIFTVDLEFLYLEISYLKLNLR